MIRAAITFAIIIVIVLGAPLGWIIYRWGYTKDTGDYSPKLTRIAKTGMPIIKEIIHYREQYGRYPTAEELRVLVNDPRLHSGISLSNGVIAEGHWLAQFTSGEWRYVPNTPNFSFFLLYRVTGIQSLVYEYDEKAKTGVWEVTLAGEIGRDRHVKLNP